MKSRKYEKEITELKEEIKALKLSYTEKTATKNSFSNKKKLRFKKRESILHNFWRSNQDRSTSNIYKLHTKHHDHLQT